MPPTPPKPPPQPCYAEATGLPGRFSFNYLTPAQAKALHAWARAQGIRNMNLTLTTPHLDE